MTQDTPAALPAKHWEWARIEARIQALQAATAYPESVSVAQAMKQLVNELWQEYGRETSTQAATSAAGGTTGELVMEKIDTMIASINGAHQANREDWRQACFAAADLVHAEIKGMVAALAAQSPDSGAGPEEPKADPLREEQARKAAMWDALKTMFISRGCRIEFRDLTGGRWQSRHAWEVTVGRTTVTRTSLEFALWAACQLDAEGEGYGKDWPYSMPGKSTMSRLVPSDAAALARQGAQNG